MKGLKHIANAVLGAVFACGMALGAQAQESPLVAFETMQDSLGFDAVGRLDIRDKGFCTAALVQERLILTAAHCVYDLDGSLISPDRFTFHAGLRDGRAEATRRVLRAVPHPGYLFGEDAASVALDIAVLELDRPIRTTRVQPYRIAPRPFAGDEVRVVSYGRNRAEAPSLQDSCRILGRDRDVLVMTCNVEYGSSGSPVFTSVAGQMRIASVVSAMATMDGEQVTLGASLVAPYNELMSHYAILGTQRLGVGQRVLNHGQRNDTGAKFVRP